MIRGGGIRGGGITLNQVLVGFGQTLAVYRCQQRILIVVSYWEESGSTTHAIL